MTPKWRNLSLLALAELFGMSLWFSASAVVPQLRDAWALTAGQQSWLTLSVQIGFVSGALVSAAFNLADRFPMVRFIAVCTLLGALLNGLIAVAVDSIGPALVLRFLTGACLAGIYPPGMKLVATWCKEDRGLGIGFLVGALAVGSASPHLMHVFSLGEGTWRPVLLLASASCLAGVVVLQFVRPGPYLAVAQRFHWRHAGRGLTDPAVRLANFGYFGHMWELYAMWTWVPLCLAAAYAAAELPVASARGAAFAVIAAGGVGSLLAGPLADKLGRTTITIWSLVLSGSCALAAGHLLSHPLALTSVCVFWGFTVVADSAQFSAAVSELSDPRYVGTALTVQTSLGFLLTMVTIRAVPPLVDRWGWDAAFYLLVLGPVFGIVSMFKLRGRPEAARMAGGNR